MTSPRGQTETVIHVVMSDVDWIVRCERLTYTRCATAADAIAEARVLAALVSPAKVVVVVDGDEVSVEAYAGRRL